MATLFENELVLPGVITEIIEDYTEGYDSSLFGTTESMIIIGTAFNGPVGKVVPVYSPEHAKYMFGDSFDSKSRKEASLIPAIYDAWEKGCRTIYAVRVSGKEMYKDYSFAVETNLKLRVRALTPSNINKDCFFVFETSQGEGSTGSFKIYKPASKATISEKMQGIVDTSDAILVNEINLDNYSITKETKLSDAISLFNENSANNALRLCIVDENGNDVTTTDKEAHALSVGAMFPGIYTICRNENAKGVIAVTDIEYVNNLTSPLYSNFGGAVWKKLVLNSDINAEYPIYAVKTRDLTNKILGSGVVADEKYAWLKTVGNLNKVFIKDSVDYEEVELDTFDLYKRLGSGFAKTAKVKEIKKGERETTTYYKVIETPHSDENRIVSINEGLFSMLENYGTDYRVLACASAEEKITTRLPKKDTFKVSNPNHISIKDAARSGAKEVLIASPKLDSKDFTAAKKFNIVISQMDELDKDEIIENLDTTNKYKRVPVIESLEGNFNFEDGQLALYFAPGAMALTTETKEKSEKEEATPKKVAKIMSAKSTGTAQLYAYNKKAKRMEIVKSEYFTLTQGGKVKEKLAVSEEQDGNVVLVPMEVAETELTNESYVFKKANVASLENKYVIIESTRTNVAKVEAGYLTPVASLLSLLDLESGDDYTMAYIDEVPYVEATAEKSESLIRVISNKLEWSSYEDLVQDLNEEKELSKLFSFALADPTLKLEDTGLELKACDIDRKEPVYDTNMYIPYTTSDNFARLFAQHAMMTSFHSYPTHAIIGCKPLSGTTLDAVAKRVDEISELDLDLYFKKTNGNNMLDKNNMPYPIGRCISLTFIPYGVTTGNGYTTMTSGAAGYAGMVSTLSAERSSTNQPIKLNSLSVELSSSQLKKLSGKGVVVCKQSTKGIVVADGVTQAPKDSPFARLSSTKVMNVVDKMIREACEPFIGLQENLSNRNSLETSIKSGLNKLLENLLKAYDFSLSGQSDGQKVGVIYVDYVIVPTNEIKEIRNRVTVK